VGGNWTKVGVGKENGIDEKRMGMEFDERRLGMELMR